MFSDAVVSFSVVVVVLQRSGRANYLNNRPKLMPSAKARAKAQEEGHSRDSSNKDTTQILSSPLYYSSKTVCFLGFQLFCIKTLNTQGSLSFSSPVEKKTKKRALFLRTSLLPPLPFLPPRTTTRAFAKRETHTHARAPKDTTALKEERERKRE